MGKDVSGARVNETITFSLGDLLAIFGFLFQVALTIGAVAFSHGSLSQRVRAVEAHGEKVDQIAPLQSAFDAFKTSINTELKNMRDDVRELAQSIRDLARARA